jgi:kynureninase
MGLLDHVRDATGAAIEVFTPREDDRRGSQVSVRFPGRGKAFFDALTARGVIADWREPDCIRMAPVPLYNSFEDLSRLESILLDLLTP